jgi:hypothetical protein
LVTTDATPKPSFLRRLPRILSVVLCLTAVISLALEYSVFFKPYLLDFRGMMAAVCFFLWLMNWLVRLGDPLDDARIPWEKPRNMKTQAAVEIAVLVITMFLASTGQFVRWRLQWSAPAMEQCARELSARFQLPARYQKDEVWPKRVPELEGGRWLGLIHIQRVEVHQNGAIAFFTEHDRGIAFVPEGAFAPHFQSLAGGSEQLSGPWWKWWQNRGWLFGAAGVLNAIELQLAALAEKEPPRPFDRGG